MLPFSRDIGRAQTAALTGLSSFSRTSLDMVKGKPVCDFKPLWSWGRICSIQYHVSLDLMRSVSREPTCCFTTLPVSTLDSHLVDVGFDLASAWYDPDERNSFWWRELLTFSNSVDRILVRAKICPQGTSAARMPDRREHCDP